MTSHILQKEPDVYSRFKVLSLIVCLISAVVVFPVFLLAKSSSALANLSTVEGAAPRTEIVDSALAATTSIANNGLTIGDVSHSWEIPSSQSIWPMSGYDQRRTGRSSNTVDLSMPTTPRWTKTLPSNLYGEPVVSAENKIYFAGDKLYAVNPDGSDFATPVSLPGIPAGSPAIDDLRGFVYFGFSVDAAQQQLFVVRYDKHLSNPTTIFDGGSFSGGMSAIIVTDDGTVLIPYGAYPQRLSARGTNSWNTQLCSGEGGRSPSVSGNAIFMFCGHTFFYPGLRIKIDLLTGDHLADIPDATQNWREAVVDASGNLLTGHQEFGGAVYSGEYVKFGPDLNRIGPLDTGNDAFTNSRPALMPDGSSTVRIGYSDFPERHLRSVGANIWTLASHDPNGIQVFTTTPSVDSAGRILAGRGHRLQVLAPTNGSTLWQSDEIASRFQGQPVIGGEGSVYIATEDAKLHAYGVPVGPGETPTPTPTPTPECPPSLQQSVNTTDSNPNFSRIAQVFIPDIDLRISDLRLETQGFFNNSSSNPSVTVRLYRASNPNDANPGNLLATSDAWPARDCLGYDPPGQFRHCFADLKFSSQPILSAGMGYIWVAEFTGASSNVWGDANIDSVGGVAWVYAENQWVTRLSGPSTSLAPTNFAFTLFACPVTRSPAYNETRLEEAYPGDLGNRKPVILIHGLHGNRWPDCEGSSCDSVVTPYPHYFKRLIENLNNSSAYNQEYKTYKFHWVSDSHSVKEIGEALRDHIYRENPEFAGKQITIVTHSTGGLIARWYMLEPTVPGGSQLSGDRVDKVITLAAPHHGTYAANRDSRQAAFGEKSILNPRRGLADIIFSWSDKHYWSKTCTNCINSVAFENRKSLLWDDFDHRSWMVGFPNEKGDEPPSVARFDDKITAYYGQLDMTDPYWALTTTVVGSPLSLIAGVKWQWPLDINDHAGAAQAAFFIDSVDKGFFPFGLSDSGNDGLIPLDSGKFKNGIPPDHAILCKGNNHARMRDGSGRLCSDNQILLSSVRNKILGTAPATPGFISGTLRALFGRLPLFSQGTEHRSDVETAADPNVSRVELTNAGDQPFQVKALTVSGPNADQFSIVGAPSLPFSVPVNRSVFVNVGFNPTSVGDKTANLVVVTNSANPQFEVALSGTGYPIPCNLTLSPANGFVSASGGTSVISIGNIPCGMSVTASETWLHPVVVGDHVEFVTDANPGTAQRDGLVFIDLDGGPALTFAVSQSPANEPCGLNFSAEQALVPTSGGNGGFDTTTPGECSWTYQSDAEWLTLGASGVLTGSQQVSFATGLTQMSRVGHITVSNGTATAQFTVTQPGPASISGRVLSADGRGVTNASVTVQPVGGSPITVRTSRLGYFSFANLPAGVVYTVTVSSRRYRFTAQALQLTDNVTDLNFTADP